MKEIEILDRIAISVKSHKLLRILLRENPVLDEIMKNSRNETEALIGVIDRKGACRPERRLQVLPQPRQYP